MNHNQETFRLSAKRIETFAGKVLIKGTIETKTGLHIGGEESAIEVGGIGNVILRNRLTRKPYIPGSALRGKMRALLERRLGKEQNWSLRRDEEDGTHLVRIHVCIDTNGGYFFLVKYFDENIKVKLRAVLRLLGEQGISGDRSSGHGRFEPEFQKQKLTFDVPDDADHFISLSLLYPQKCELANGLLNGEAAYNFITRDGWFFSRMSYLSSIKRRQKRRMFAEGSVFHSAPDAEYYGQITDVKPPDFSEHPVFRWGIGFPIGVKL